MLFYPRVKLKMVKKEIPEYKNKRIYSEVIVRYWKWHFYCEWTNTWKKKLRGTKIARGVSGEKLNFRGEFSCIVSFMERTFKPKVCSFRYVKLTWY